LAARLDVAGRAMDLLEHKQQLLLVEQRRLAERVRTTETEWLALATEAERGNLRALVSGGRDELRRAERATVPARVQLSSTTQAGVSYPDSAEIELGPTPALAGPPALPLAAAACRRALEAAVHHAAAAGALRLVNDELVVTGRRLRAIRDRWIPHLEAQMTELDLRLDDGEREEVTRLRWAGRPASRRW
jgi:V/A-type H+-transporting ATPase subunit D